MTRHQLIHNISLYKILENLIVCLVVSTFFGFAANAQEVIDVNYLSRTKGGDQVSRDALVQNAIESVSRENIRLLIGAAKADRNQKVINEKVIKNSSRYILSMKNGGLEKRGGDMVMPIEMKVSLKNLRAILLEEGLLYQMEGSPKTLSLVSIEDRIASRQYAWWADSSARDVKDLSDMSLKFEQLMKDELGKITFVGLTPQASAPAGSAPNNLVPAANRIFNLQKTESLSLGERLKSQMVVRGEVIIRQKPASETMFMVEYNIQALHAGNGRLIAEVQRTFDTDAGVYRTVTSKTFYATADKVIADLVAQVNEVWKKGVFGASALRLVVTGNLNPQSMDQFKRMVPLQVRDVKNIRERRIEARVTTFELDATGVPQQLAVAFKGANFAPYRVSIKDVQSDGLTVEVQQ